MISAEEYLYCRVDESFDTSFWSTVWEVYGNCIRCVFGADFFFFFRVMA